MLDQIPVDPRLATILHTNREAIAERLVDLEWLADPSDPRRLVSDRASVRPRVDLFLDSLEAGLGGGDWTLYMQRIGEPTAELLRTGVRSAQQINERVLQIVGVLVPYVAAAPDCDGMLIALFATMQQLSSGLVADQHAYLLGESGRLNDIKSLFMRLTSHELRGPLTVTNGYASLLLDSGDDATTELVNTAATHILSASETALSLIDGLTEVASLEQGAGVLKIRSVRLGEVVERAVCAVAAEAGAGGVTIEPDVDDGMLEVDPDRCVIAVRNMVANAVKYGGTDGGGVTVVRVRAALASHGRAEIEVADDGPGIPADELELIFDRYYRSSASRRANIPGSGLGLYIVKRIAELHGGDVSVRSEPGQGSTFVLSLPVTSCPPTGGSVLDPSPAA